MSTPERATTSLMSRPLEVNLAMVLSKDSMGEGICWFADCSLAVVPSLLPSATGQKGPPDCSPVFTSMQITMNSLSQLIQSVDHSVRVIMMDYQRDGISSCESEDVSARDGGGTETLNVSPDVVDDIETSEGIPVGKGTLLSLHVFGIIKKHRPFTPLATYIHQHQIFNFENLFEE